VTAEVAVATFAVYRLSDPIFREAVSTTLTMVGDSLIGSVRSAWVLLQMDTLGTLGSLGWTAGTLLLTALPILVRARRWRGWSRLRLLWLCLLYYLLPLAAASSVPLLAVVSAASIVLMRHWWLRWTAFLPLAVMCASVPIHQFDIIWNRAALAERCQRNDGRRPINLKPQQIAPQYKGVTQLRPDEALLPGVFHEEESDTPLGGAWWLRRQAGKWRIDAPSEVIGTFWPGCVIGDELWLNRPPNVVLGVRRDPQTGVESIREVKLPVQAMDFEEVACLPDEGLVLVTEALNGSGIWAISVKTGEGRRLTNPVGGIGAVARLWKPGRVVVTNGNDLMIYSLEREEVIARTPAAVQMFGGMDVCPLDDEVAICDVIGRCRFFTPDEEGTFRFDWGISLRAPRTLVYSPDCSHIVVTSWDDESVWLIERATRSIVASYRVGPAVRGITFLGPREFAIADVCTMSDFVF